MKNYEEMARDVLHRIDEYEIKRKEKRATVLKLSSTVVPLCAAIAVGVGLWITGATINENTPANNQTGIVAASESDTISSMNNDVSGKKKSHDGKDNPNSATDGKTINSDTINSVSDNGTGCENNTHTSDTHSATDGKTINSDTINSVSDNGTGCENNTHISDTYSAIVSDKNNTELIKDSSALSITSEESNHMQLFYSRLVENCEVPELDISGRAEMSLDILPFNEKDLSKYKEYNLSIITGVVSDIYTRDYSFTTASDKFEPNGVLYHNEKSVVYKIEVQSVLYGSFNVGDTITVEDNYFILDSLISVKKGGTYVIPIYNCGEKMYIENDVLTGDIIRESPYTTFYQFQPQIQFVDDGYIVPSTWGTFITDECLKINVDIVSENGDYFTDKMYFVPENIFRRQMTEIIQRELSD